MIYTVIEEEFPRIGSGLPRSPGLHVTDIIKYIEDQLGKEYKKFGEPWLCMEVGFFWEDTLSSVFASRTATRIGEIECDGISMSPDGVGPDPYSDDPLAFVLEEYKATWKSSKNHPIDNWYWMTQCKSYLYALKLDTVIMRILYLMGDYHGTGPQYRVFKLTFTPEEIADNWQIILAHKQAMLNHKTIN